MARTLTPLPAALTGRAFSSREAAAVGISRRTLQHPRFERPHRGVVRIAPTIAEPAFLEQRAAANAQGYAPLLRAGEAFSHTTALLLLGVPVRAHPEVHVTIPRPSSPARGRGVHGHTIGAPVTAARGRHALPCVPPLTALLQSAARLQFPELVIALDHLMLLRGASGRERPIIARESLERVLRGAAVPGIRRLRAAFEIARIGAASRMESLLHYELARLGLDDLELQGELHDRNGAWIGRFDEVDRVRRKILEYDGEQHRTDRRQYLLDEMRLERARRRGYDVLRLHREDLRPAALPDTHRTLCEFLAREPRPIPPRLARAFATDGRTAGSSR